MSLDHAAGEGYEDYRLDRIDAAPVEQAVEGMRLAVCPQCVFCKEQIPRGATCTVYAYRPAGDPQWSVARLFCSTCCRQEVEHPSRTCFEAVCRARVASVSDVARQEHSACVLGVRALDLSPATEGSQL